MVIPTSAVLFLYPTYSLFLHDIVKIPYDYAGYIFGVQSVFYMSMSPVTGRLQSKISKRVLMAIGLFLYSAVYFVQGPAPVMGI